jgi:hypothetical protein
MARAIRFRFSGHPRAPRARIGAAIAASALAHGLLLSASTDLQWRSAAPGSDGAPITVWLAQAQVHSPVIPANPPMEARRSTLPEQLPTSGSDGLSGVRSAKGPAEASVDALPLPETPDPNFYAARDLDSYPTPLTALRIDGSSGAGGGEVRLEVLIDERGIVREINFAGAIRPGGAEEELRALMAATRFVPGVKDGRAVRSRILLSFTP